MVSCSRLLGVQDSSEIESVLQSDIPSAHFKHSNSLNPKLQSMLSVRMA